MERTRGFVSQAPGIIAYIYIHYSDEAYFSPDIIESPSDACVCEGQLVQLDCTVMVTAVVGGMVETGIADQGWKINFTSSMVIEVLSTAVPADMSYMFMRNIDGRPIGLMFSANNIHNLANFSCIGFDVNQQGLTPLSTNAATLEVAGMSAYRLLCSQYYVRILIIIL